MSGLFAGLAWLFSLVGWIFLGMGIGTRIKQRRAKIVPTKSQRWRWWALMCGAWLLGGACGLIAKNVDTRSSPVEDGSANQATLSDLDAALGAQQSQGTGECVDQWIVAYREEQGQEAIVTQDQIGEWTDWCNQGKRPSG